MEALVLILGEMVFALLAPLVAVVVDFIGAILASVLSFFPSRRSEPRGSDGLTQKLLIALVVIGVALLGALFVANKFYFAESIRVVLGTLERRAGIETECSEISGSVFSGRLTLGDCTIGRTNHTNSDFQLELDALDFDLRLRSLLGTAEVETAHISGLRGSVNRHKVQDDSPEASVEKPRRAFVIQDLKVEDVAIELTVFNKDGGSFDLPVKVTSATSSPLRSRLALFDILFRSDANGVIAGAEFEIETRGDSKGRQTIWRATDLPVADFGAMTGGVLSWFQHGIVNVYVEDHWRRDGQLEIDMDWKLDFREIEVKAPDTAGAITRFATAPILDYVNSQGSEFPFEFQMVINESQFEYQSSLAAAGLWSAVGESVNSILARVGIEPATSASETGEKLKEEAKSVLDRLRKPTGEDD
ncbi:MAG: hypothetical protein QNJ14_15890 [Woeseiaceae bacterium]|nr:hypothetical protein [Woeseiaceae bacterium]